MEDGLEDDANTWREWGPVSTDGEMAAFIELVSDGKVYASSRIFMNTLGSD